MRQHSQSFCSMTQISFMNFQYMTHRCESIKIDFPLLPQMKASLIHTCHTSLFLFSLFLFSFLRINSFILVLCKMRVFKSIDFDVLSRFYVYKHLSKYLEFSTRIQWVFVCVFANEINVSLNKLLVFHINQNC